MPEIRTALEQLPLLPFWQHLDDEGRALVRESAMFLQYRQGQQIHSSHSHCLGAILVLKGVLRTYLLSPDGREMTLLRTRAGESYLLTAACVLESISFDTQVDAEEDTDILLVPSSVYSTLVAADPRIECDSYKMLLDSFSDVITSIERLVFLSLEQRIASFLLDEASSAGADCVNMTHEQIAVNIGSARVAVNRSLNAMAKQGLLELFRGGVRLADKEALYGLLQV